MIFGKNNLDLGMLAPIVLNGDNLQYVSEIKYLGTTIIAGKKFSFSAKADLASFYRASNSVINVLVDAHEEILLQLLYTNCVPIISYACAVKQYSSRDMSSCNVAINNVIRKIFSFERWESTRSLRQSFGYKSIYEIFEKSRGLFLKSCKTHPNPIVTFVLSLNLD